MLINELFDFNHHDDPGTKVPNTLADYFISLKANDVEEIETKAAQEEIMARFQQDVSIEELTQMHAEGKLPMVKDINSEKITLDIIDSEIKNKDVEGSDDAVSDMAKQASNAAQAGEI